MYAHKYGSTFVHSTLMSMGWSRNCDSAVCFYTYANVSIIWFHLSALSTKWVPIPPLVRRNPPWSVLAAGPYSRSPPLYDGSHQRQRQPSLPDCFLVFIPIGSAVVAGDCSSGALEVGAARACHRLAGLGVRSRNSMEQRRCPKHWNEKLCLLAYYVYTSLIFT